MPTSKQWARGLPQSPNGDSSLPEGAKRCEDNRQPYENEKNAAGRRGADPYRAKRNYSFFIINYSFFPRYGDKTEGTLRKKEKKKGGGV